MKTKSFILIFLFAFATFCNGQVNNISNDSLVAIKACGPAQPKLVTRSRTDKNHRMGQNVHCSLVDKWGNLWFGTTGDGVYRFDGKSFVNFTTKEGLSDISVWSVMQDKDGYIWLGTGDGVCRFNGTWIISIPLPAYRQDVKGKIR